MSRSPEKLSAAAYCLTALVSSHSQTVVNWRFNIFVIARSCPMWTIAGSSPEPAETINISISTFKSHVCVQKNADHSIYRTHYGVRCGK